MKILHVDDEADILEQSKIYLEAEDDRLDVRTAISAEKGLKMLERGDFDAVISDYQMPGLNGLEFLDIIRNQEKSDIPFIVFTGRGREEVAIRALNLGANRYIQKGGDPKPQFVVLARSVVQEVESRLMRRRFKDFFENLPYMAFIINSSGIVEELNNSFIQSTGYKKEEIVGKPMVRLVNIIPFKSLLKSVRKFYEFLQNNEISPFEIEYKHKSGEIRRLEINAVSMGNDKELDRVIGVARDITDDNE